MPADTTYDDGFGDMAPFAGIRSSEPDPEPPGRVRVLVFAPTPRRPRPASPYSPYAAALRR